ncbi:hypothetical protein E3N88_09480 [Mikania micrantha]|uniref:Rit1 N-terminal domain-containing protein n=1 Tax=Mikania micrantha TaxID=192012 RepID=A0A5N6PJ85_9ASTR|nr:hypothetical protein E3N88_09480 [Mikania micrantha]
MVDDTASMSTYRASRTIKRKQSSLFNSLSSIHEDSIFVSEIAQLWPELPLVANLRCGLWYAKKFHSSCYFKSTDGHTNNLSFNTSRINLHVATLAGQRGVCMIVDSTRKGKRFPDMVANIVEKDRVFRAQGGQTAPQVSVKSKKSESTWSNLSQNQPLDIIVENGISGDLLDGKRLAVCCNSVKLHLNAFFLDVFFFK